MARKQVDRQLRLFGLGDLGEGDDGRDLPDGRSVHQSWDEVMADLGRLLRQARFEVYLARRESEDRGEQR